MVQHHIILQQADGNNYPLPYTEFGVDLQLKRVDRDEVELSIPQINFQTQSVLAPDNGWQFNFIAGGSIMTAKHPLPESWRPRTIETFLGSNNDIFLQPISLFNPVAPGLIESCFNVQIDQYGNLRILGSGSYVGIIPVGGHTLNPLRVRYKTCMAAKKQEECKEPCKKECNEQSSKQSSKESSTCVSIQGRVVEKGFGNLLLLTGQSANDAIRDTHINDAYRGRSILTYSSNKDQTNPALPIMDAYVAVASSIKQAKRGKFKNQNLTRFTSATENQGYVFIWDTAVAISRKDRRTVVYSAGLKNESVLNTWNVAPGAPVYFRSTDGGKNWSGLLYLDPVQFPLDQESIFGDCRGVVADDCGNFLYSVTKEFADPTSPYGFYTQMYYYFSNDGAQTWALVYATANAMPGGLGWYDFPQIRAGPNGAGQTGFWFYADFITTASDDADSLTVLGFLPVVNNTITPNLNGAFGDGTMQQYTIVNNIITATLTVDPEARVYLTTGTFWSLTDYGTITNVQVLKQPPNPGTPDPLDLSLYQAATTISNATSQIPLPVSYPGGFGYANTSNTTAFDTKRNVLYVVYLDVGQPNTQNYQLWLRVGYNGAVSYGPAFLVGSSDANKGYQSLAYDRKSDTLYISYYSAQNSSGGTLIQFFCATVDSCQLDQIVAAQ